MRRLRPLSQVGLPGMVACGHTKGASNMASCLMIFLQSLGCMIACFKLETVTYVATSHSANNFERLMKGLVKKSLL
jgi:hypothetical protein